MHTLGILLEDSEYKQAVRDANIPQLMSTLFRSLTGDNGNPLRDGSPTGGNKMTYELMNKKAGSYLYVLCLLYSHLFVAQHLEYANRSFRHRLIPSESTSTILDHSFTFLLKISSDPLFLRGTLKQNARRSRELRTLLLGNRIIEGCTFVRVCFRSYLA